MGADGETGSDRSRTAARRDRDLTVSWTHLRRLVVNAKSTSFPQAAIDAG